MQTQAGLFGDLPAEVIDHQAGHPATVEAAVSPEYGEYLVALATCRDCHGAQLDGVVAGGPLANYSAADFIETIRTGVTPDGRTLSDEMPWQFYANMEDQDLAGIFAYLQSPPPSGQ